MFLQFEDRLFDQVVQVTRFESTVADQGLRIQQGFAYSRLEQLQSTRLQIEEQEGRTRDQVDGIRRHTESFYWGAPRQDGRDELRFCL
jgi:hypothetical protein